MRTTKPHPRSALVPLGALAIFALLSGTRSPRLVWNASASAPVGLYTVSAEAHAKVGDLVLATPPQRVAAFAAARGYLPLHVPLIKHIAARPGDRVCAGDAALRINAVAAAHILRADSRGRMLPHWHGCVVLHGGEVLLLNAAPASFDGRYFGPVAFSSVIGRLEPLWTR